MESTETWLMIADVKLFSRSLGRACEAEESIVELCILNHFVE